MTLISAEIFQKAQAQAYNQRGIVRVMELRQAWRKTFPPINPEMAAEGSSIYREFQQIDALITFLLDINGETGTMELVENTEPTPPKGAA